MRDIEQKRWDMVVASLTHTPMTKEAGKATQRHFKEIESQLSRALRAMEPIKKRRARKGDPIVSTVTYQVDPGDDVGDLLAGVKKTS